MTVGQMREVMSNTEFGEWKAFAQWEADEYGGDDG